MSGSEQNRVRSLRTENGYSGQEVASKLGISVQYLYDIERNKRKLGTELAGQLADIFKVSVDYLLKRTDLRNQENVKNSDTHEESELSEISIEKLNTYKLSYKGHSLSKEEADDITELLEAALKRWKK